MKIACLQSLVAHYRTEFFLGLQDKYDFNLYIYKDKDTGGGFCKSGIEVKEIGAKKIGPITFFDFKKLRKDGNDIIVFPFQAKTTFACMHLLLLSKIYHFKVILWGHGISIPRYLKEERSPNPLLKLQLRFVDACWVYMDKEAEQWKKIFPNKPIAALHNTITGAEDILRRPSADKNMLKEKYGIKEERVVIYCARCTAQRRFDLFVSVIEQLKNESIGFIIIGAGEDKPDFSNYPHVNDFGAVYDTDVKNELFDIADVYFQPGWVGLSIVEAMLYGKPVLTFKRKEDILQCVEYSYIQENVNGHIVESVDEASLWLTELTDEDLHQLSNRTKEFASKNLTMNEMVSNACSIIDKIQ